MSLAHQKLCCTGTCHKLRLRTPALPGATLLLQLGTTKWLRPRGPSVKPWPRGVSILCNLDLLSCPICRLTYPASYRSKRKQLVPLQGEERFPFGAWRLLGCRKLEMTSVQFVVHPLPGTQEQLAEKLKSVADRLNKYGHQGVSAVSGIREEVKQIAGNPPNNNG